ncbi:RING/U-box protein [Quillaja saponaria]|uniref:RING/U-box protein n=1 Tax=Quillaja saponaria TaxID=32244 RepID=A0AAD7P7W0_QUISA|nr:RING/U-box protein [Quillaja saponaria]
MEVEVVTSGIAGEDALEFDDNSNNDNLFTEGERCGICMDIIVDRGVLDCCQHWFCFVCIDNWATITNLCPLCQNEFQLITCVPVYDTTGSNKVDDDSFSRDDDWCIEATNNTLSFPSYYINENAVICLDGDDCKIRGGLATIEGDSSLDTSIACDSCDIWYHAFCVGFDPEGTSEDTWLCPRCLVDKLQNGDVTPTQRNMECIQGDANSDCHVKDSFSGKVSVSVADTGETAVVVSMVGGLQLTPMPSENGLSPLVSDKDPMNESFVSVSTAKSHKVETEKTISSLITEEQDLELSLSRNVSCNLLLDFVAHNELNTDAHEITSESSSVYGIGDSVRMLSNESGIRSNSSKNESSMGLHLGLSVGSFLSVDGMNNNETKELTDVQLWNLSEGKIKDSGDEIEPDANEDTVQVVGEKRKHTDCSNQAQTNDDHRHTNPELATEVSRKKTKAEGTQLITSKDKENASILDNQLKQCLEKEDVTSDIMSIVKGTKQKLSKELDGPNSFKLSEEPEHLVGLRVKKIMRRATDDKESFMAVQDLRKEIREAVRNKSSNNVGESPFDPKLLAAFRAAVAGSKSEPVKKLSPLAVKAKKLMLQKGRVRENLTKKIYGTSNGKRKRAWDRECEVEFWKYRCMGISKPEKIETLKSVLDLLRKGSDSSEPKEESESQAMSPILSRLYLADTSVLPRKDDIRPLSALKTAANSEQNKEQSPLVKGSKSLLDTSNTKPTETKKVLSKVGFCSFENKGNKKNAPGSDGDSASCKVHLRDHLERASVSPLRGSKVDTKELDFKSDNMKSDKKKWALQVLARKTAAVGGKATDKNQTDTAILKGNYPLLAQLPADMRPVLASSRHNKIPIPVRQVTEIPFHDSYYCQLLYRHSFTCLTEHLLRKANLPVIRRTADAELAVADAINIEKEVADRSNSKLVYLNLCSQELLHHSGNRKSDIAKDTNPSLSSAGPCDRSEQHADELPTDPAVEEALRNAGLLSDSPPSSPHDEREICNDDHDPSGPDNVFEMDSHPELDIYGDFEYDLEDADYIGASAAKVSNPQPEKSMSKIKVFFSTMNLNKSNSALDSVDFESSGKSGRPTDASHSPRCHHDAKCGTSIINGQTEKSCVPPESLLDECGREPSDAECEELYGPDKEPLIIRFSDGESRELYEVGDPEALVKDNGDETNEKQVSNQPIKLSECGNEISAENAFGATIGQNSTSGENSSSVSQRGENTQMEKKSNTNTKQSDSVHVVSKKVEAYVKEHIRPLCKSGVITAEQYKWAVAKTTDKVMKYHCKAKNANFLIKEGEKVKKLAEQYIETAQQN